MRTKAREVVFEVVFASRFSGGFDVNLKNALCKNENLTADDRQYVDGVISVLTEHGQEITELIDTYSLSFPQSRLFPADISALLIAIAEIKYIPDIPNPVSVNEAANIASKFSSPKSATFISGILSEIIKG